MLCSPALECSEYSLLKHLHYNNKKTCKKKPKQKKKTVMLNINGNILYTYFLNIVDTIYLWYVKHVYWTILTRITTPITLFS